MATEKSAVRGALNTTGASTANAPMPYSQALSRLEPLLPVLTGLAHRNHNQHRRAAWWRCFGMLRRNCARLVEDLISAIAAAHKNAARAAKAAKAKSKKRRREELASGSLGQGPGTGGHDSLDVEGTGAYVETDVDVTRHAAWLRDVLIPKCYLAFSQLTADNQFAPLGVVLLGVLAQIHAACDCVAPKPVVPPLSPSAREVSAPVESTPLNIESEAIPSARNTTELPALEPRPATGHLLTAPEGKKISREEAVGGRKGKAVSREDVERAAAQRKKGKEADKAQTKKVARTLTITDGAEAVAPTEGTTAIPPSKRQVLSAQDYGGDEDARPAKKTKTAPTIADRGKGQRHEPDKDKKKKKKAKKGDEFDDLFKGLF